MLALTVGVFLLIGIGSAIGSLQSEEGVSSKTVLSVKLPAFIPERTNNTEMGFEQALTEEKIWSIHELTYGIEHAATDNKIKAMIIEPGSGADPVHLDMIRKAIQKFKRSGKPVYTYSEYYSQGDYYLASAADQIYLHPIGSIEMKGFSVVQPYMKSALENLGVNAEVYYAGDFKSATEPVRSDEMSDKNRLQLKELLEEIHTSFVDTISAARNISRADLEDMINNFSSRTALDAKRLGLADHMAYESDMIDNLKKEIDIDVDKTIAVLNFEDYREKISRKKDYSADNKIAVVYAEGNIMPGSSEEGAIKSDMYIPLLRKIRRNDDIKAVVLRVNSGGGDVFTSDNILRELELIQAAGKPVVASMGYLAASGGYYISMGADSVFASPKTLTGSIGVFALFPNFSSLLNDKLEINMDSVTTAPFATFGNMSFERSEAEKEIFQGYIDSFYITFLDRVAGARNMTRDQVHEVAQGRVWTGNQALEHNLVDALGSLEDAIASASKLAEVEEYRLVEYPKIKSPIVKLTEQLEGKSDDGKKILSKKIDQFIPGFSKVEMMMSRKNKRGWIDYSMPYHINWE